MDKMQDVAAIVAAAVSLLELIFSRLDKREEKRAHRPKHTR